MFAEFNQAGSGRDRGAELAEAAEALLAEARLDSIDVAQAARLATASAVLALYWEVRHQGPGSAPLHRRDDRRQWANEPGS